VIALLSISKNLQAQSINDMSVSDLKNIAKTLADCQLKTRTLEFLMQDTVALKREIARKEGVIQTMQLQRNTFKSMLDTMQQAISKRDEIITGQQHVIEKISKVKPWGIGPSVGYGFNGLSFSLIVGVTLTRTIIRF
jgi:predicted rRNA methylase YqxC with S4 and FtsJ domains